MNTILFEKFRTVEGAREYILELEGQFSGGSGWAGFWLFNIYSEDNAFLSEECKAAIGLSNERALSYCAKAFSLLKAEAERGDGESAHLLAKYYEWGLPPISRDRDIFKYWTDKAADAGFVVLQDLLAIYADPKSKFYDAKRAVELRALVGNE